jgi:hypothetical protein
LSLGFFLSILEISTRTEEEEEEEKEGKEKDFPC